MQVEEKQSSWKRMWVCEDKGDGCSAQRGQCEQKCGGESLEGRAREQGWWEEVAVGGEGFVSSAELWTLFHLLNKCHFFTSCGFHSIKM